MDEFGPNTRAGFCPDCSKAASIWINNAWHCCYCNWYGNNPDREPKLKFEI